MHQLAHPLTLPLTFILDTPVGTYPVVGTVPYFSMDKGRKNLVWNNSGCIKILNIPIFSSFYPVLWIRIGFNARVRIQGAKPMRIHAVPRSWSDFKIRQLNFNMKNIRNISKHIPTKAGSQFYWLLLVNFHAPVSGSPTGIRIQDSQINAGSTTLIRSSTPTTAVTEVRDLL
jgi:hypothetical protein